MNMETKDKTVHDWFPQEVEILKRVIKLKGNRLKEKDFDRIFSEYKKIKLPDGSFQMTMRKGNLRFIAFTRDTPIMMHGLQQRFLMLAQSLAHMGAIFIKKIDGEYTYSMEAFNDQLEKEG